MTHSIGNHTNISGAEQAIAPLPRRSSGEPDAVRIGGGAFGTVYRVRERGGERFLARKVLMDRGLWERERRFLALADHPLFPRIEDSGEEEGAYWILMTYVWGERLDEVLDRRGPFSQPDAMRLAIEIADGLAWFQQQDGGILFRDLKAENLILQPDGSVRLVDFGSACRLSEAGESISGTRGYAPSEQLSSKMTESSKERSSLNQGVNLNGSEEDSTSYSDNQVGFYSDVYAFGMLFFYLLTAENPSFFSETPDRLRAYNPAFSASLELLIDDCTRENSSERPPDLYCVLERLVNIATATPRQYRQMERDAARRMKRRGDDSDIRFTRNIRG